MNKQGMIEHRFAEQQIDGYVGVKKIEENDEYKDLNSFRRF